MSSPPATPIVWRHTWPERGPDFVASVAGGSFARIYRTHPDALRGHEWVWCLTYPAATRVQRQGRAGSKREAADAVRVGLDAALRWHAERGEPLRLWRHDAPDRATDWRQRMPLVLVVGRDVPWPEGWGPNTRKPAPG